MYKHFYLPILITILTLILPIYAFAGPQSTNYELKEYGFGSGGTEGTDSSNYSLFGTVGEIDNGTAESTNYKTLPGLSYTMQSNVPPAPTFTNPSNYYNKLHVVLANGNNPSDATFAIAISTDNFATDTRYIQNDDTIGATLGDEDWQTYSAWGGATGFDVIGLLPNTTYTIKVAAEQGNFTQTGYSAASQASTSNVQVTFDIDVASTNTESAPPYEISMGDLTPGNVTTASDLIWIDLSTNAEFGGMVYVYDTNTGLRSSATNYTITSSSTNLATAQEGYGLRVTSATNLTAQSPYNGASDNIGVVDNTIRTLLHSGSSAVSGGRASIAVKAKAGTITPASNDYTDTLTLIATGSF